jgi:cytochrome P450
MISTRHSLSDFTGLTPLSETTTCADPQAAYQVLRERWGQVAPVELEPGVPAWLVMGYPEILHVVRNERLFARNPLHWRLLSDGVVRQDSGLGPMMFPRDNAYFADGARHRRLRAPLDEGIAGMDQHALRRSLQATCRDLIRGFAKRGEADLVTEYASVIPMLAVSSLFGISTEHGHQLRAGLIALFGSGEDSQEGNRTFERILTEVMQSHAASPAEDLTTAFLAHPNLHDSDEVAQSIVLMISAGYETTTAWIAQTIRLMLADPRFAGRLHGGRLGVDDALDEVLFRDPPMANMPARYALADTELAGQPIRAGDALILGLSAANADARMHTDDPWLETGNRSHLAFSAGPHTCPALDPSRLITRTAVTTALTELHDLTLAILPDEIELLPSPWTRCPASLPVRFVASDVPIVEQEVSHG